MRKMINQSYKKQVRLLLDVLPEVTKETCFVLHGGTAINLFVRDMARLSIDIDLTYLPIEDRKTTLSNIAEALERTKQRLKDVLKNVRVLHKIDAGKLMISRSHAEIKLEVNLVGRGVISDPVKMQLCDKAQSEFDAFVAMPVVPFGQLYGGKICAALDRQHPRDLFDVKYLLENVGFTDEIRRGFIYCLLCSDRPMNELLVPNFQDQRRTMQNHFAGMSEEDFSYQDFEETRDKLVGVIGKSLSDKDKEFLLSVKNVSPDWGIYDFERFPAVQWKLQNLSKLKTVNPEKHKQLCRDLKKSFLSNDPVDESG